MGCCCKLGTDAVMANLFAGSEYPVSYTIDEIREYANFLTEKMPGHIENNVSEPNVRECCEALPELYTFLYTEDGKATVSSRELHPDAALLMSLYSFRFARRVSLLTKSYIDRITKTKAVDPQPAVQD